jgi:hypothetical protein
VSYVPYPMCEKVSLSQNRGVFPSWGDTSSFIGPNFLLNLVQRTVFLSMEHQLGPLPYRSAEYKQPNMLLPIWRSFHHFNFNPAIGSNASFENTLPQSTYRGRDENKRSVSDLAAGAHTATLYVMVTRVKGGGGAPHPQQPGLNFPS